MIKTAKAMLLRQRKYQGQFDKLKWVFTILLVLRTGDIAIYAYVDNMQRIVL